MQIKDVSRRWGADTQLFLMVAKLCKKQDHNQNTSVANTELSLKGDVNGSIKSFWLRDEQSCLQEEAWGWQWPRVRSSTCPDLAKPGSSLSPNVDADCLWAVHSTYFLKFRARQIYPATPEGCWLGSELVLLNFWSTDIWEGLLWIKDTLRVMESLALSLVSLRWERLRADTSIRQGPAGVPLSCVPRAKRSR